MSTALPKIDQAGKPVGVAGQSRDDLDLFTLPGTEIALSDGGVGATLWQWTILDQPPGATAFLTTPNAATTNLSNATVRGSYFVQLVVDGGALPAQVYRIVAGVQLDTPSWVTPPINRPLRIPAKGESLEFNVESSPGAGANSRGWAQEMDHWFRAIAAFGFGVQVQNSGAPFGSEAFYTLDFVGMNLVDAGGGVLQVAGLLEVEEAGVPIGSRPILNFLGLGVSVVDNPGNNSIDVTVAGGSGGIEAHNEGAALIPGGPWNQILIRQPQHANLLYFQSMSNAVVQPGTGEAEIVVTAAHHQANLHSGGILISAPSSLGRAALQCSVLTVPNPMTLVFNALSASGPDTQVVADGAVFDTTTLPAPLSFSLPATAGKALKLLVLAAKTTGPDIADVDVAVARSVAIPVIITNLHRDFPDGAINITLSGGFLSLDNGPVAAFQVGKYVRLYNPTGYYWIEVYCHAAEVDGVETWAISESWRRFHVLCTLALVPYWLDGAVSTWGVNIVGTQKFVDARQFGSIGATELQDTALQVIDRMAGDMQWQAGVVFTHEEAQYTSGESHLDAFGLAPATSGAPQQDAAGVRGGVCWANGRRFVAADNVLIAAFGFASVPICIAAKVSMPQGTAQIVAFRILSGNPIDAVKRCLVNSNANPVDSTETNDIYVPLYFGMTNPAGDALLVDGRVDLRRDVAHYGQWTAACRDPSTATLAYLGSSYQSRIGLMTAANWFTAGKSVAEFGSIAAALAWHGALTGSDNLTPLASISGVFPFNNVSASIKVIGDTLETFPIHLRNNVTVQGEGNPFVFVPPTRWWSNFGIPAYTWTYFNIGDSFTTQRFVYGVTVRDLSIIMTSYDSAVQGFGGASIGALTITAGDYNNAISPPPPATWQLTGTTQNVLVENVGFDLLDVSLLQLSDRLAAIRLQDVSGPNLGGTFNNVKIRECKTPVLAGRIGASLNMRAFNTAVCLHLTHFVLHNDVGIEGCSFSVNTVGIYADSLFTVLANLQIKDNIVETTLQAGVLLPEAYGIFFGAGIIAYGSISNNSFNLLSLTALSRAIRLGCGMADFAIEGNKVPINNGPSPASAGIALFPDNNLLRVKISDNMLHSQGHGVYINVDAGHSVSALTIVDNECVCENVSTVIGTGVYVNVPSTTCDTMKVCRNTLTAFISGVIVNIVDGSAISIDENVIVSSSALADSFCCSITAANSLVGLNVHNNVMRDARIGVFASLPSITGGISIESNNISCHFDTIAFGSFNSRGVHVVALPHSDASAGLSICNNVIRKTLCMSPSDTMHGGGVVIENQSTFMWSDVTVRGNDIMVHDESMHSLTAADFTAISGIALHGPIRTGKITENKIVNRVVRIRDSVRHGGVVVLHNTSFTPLRDHELQINNNEITWCDASYVDGMNTLAAGVLVDAPLMVGVQINNNTIGVQSISTFDLAFVGSLHGILTGPNNGTPAGLQIVGNKIYAWKYDVGAEKYGVCGCAIWMFGALSSVLVTGNHCTGYFRKNFFGAGGDREYWAVIAAAVHSDPYDNIADTRIEGNSVFNLNGDLGGIAQGLQNISNGIRVGSPAMSGDVGYNCAVCDNTVAGFFDATGSFGLDAAGIALIASNIGNASRGQLLQVSGNIVRRISMNGVPVCGILLHGWREVQVNDNIVDFDSLGIELYERGYAGAVASNIWTNNRCGTAVNIGTISFASPPYQAQPAPNNWDGSVFA